MEGARGRRPSSTEPSDESTIEIGTPVFVSKGGGSSSPCLGYVEPSSMGSASLHGQSMSPHRLLASYQAMRPFSEVSGSGSEGEVPSEGHVTTSRPRTSDGQPALLLKVVVLMDRKTQTSQLNRMITPLSLPHRLATLIPPNAEWKIALNRLSLRACLALPLLRALHRISTSLSQADQIPVTRASRASSMTSQTRPPILHPR